MSFPLLATTVAAVNASGPDSGNQEVGFRSERWSLIGRAISQLRGVPTEGLLGAIAYATAHAPADGAAILCSAEEGGLVYDINRCLTSAVIAGYSLEHGSAAAAAARMWRGNEAEPTEVLEARSSGTPVFGGATMRGKRSAAPVRIKLTPASAEAVAKSIYWKPSPLVHYLFLELNGIRAKFTGSDVAFIVQVSRGEAALIAESLANDLAVAAMPDPVAEGFDDLTTSSVTAPEPVVPAVDADGICRTVTWDVAEKCGAYVARFYMAEEDTCVSEDLAPHGRLFTTREDAVAFCLRRVPGAFADEVVAAEGDPMHGYNQRTQTWQTARGLAYAAHRAGLGVAALPDAW